MRRARPRRAAPSLALALASLWAPVVPVRAAAAAVHVPGDAATIQQAIDTVDAGGTVLVASGIYRENIDFHGRGVEVRSAEGPTATVIDGGGAGAVVTFDENEPRASMLRGFTVRNGGASGVFIQYASPTIVGNVITANRGANGGGGLTLRVSQALIKDNVIRGNTGEGGGFLVTVARGAEIVGNTIEDNTAHDGGGMSLFGSRDPLIAENVFRGNRASTAGGAIAAFNSSEALIIQNVFVDNAAHVGGALAVSVPFDSQGATVAHNTLAGNRANGGSAIWSSGDWLAVNNVIAGEADTSAVMCVAGPPARFLSNAVFNGTAAPIASCPDADLSGTSFADPLLRADFGLAAGSPAIDAGLTAPPSPPLRPADANGAPRVVDGNGDGTAVVDRGAFEWPGAGLTADTETVPASYHPLPPRRILDTRVGLGWPSKLTAGATATLDVHGVGGIPGAGVSAVVLNVTVTEPSTGGFLTVWPGGDARPLASNLNFVAGQTVPNAVVVKVGAGGQVNLFNHMGSVHLVADVSGWYGAHSGSPGATYHPMQPTRLLDTRTGAGAPVARVGPAATLSLQVTGRGGVPATGVSAVALNVTVTEPTAVSYLSVWPAGDAQPLVSSLNFAAGDTVANLVIVKVGAGGAVSLYNSGGFVHVVADVAGWFGPDTVQPQGAYVPLAPSRILDTRLGVGAPQAPVGPGTTLGLQIVGRAGIPAGAVAAVVLNVTVTDPSSVSFLTAWPGGTSRPLASNLNYRAGQTVPNLVVVPVGADGTVQLFTYAGSADVVADVAGWYLA